MSRLGTAVAALSLLACAVEGRFAPPELRAVEPPRALRDRPTRIDLVGAGFVSTAEAAPGDVSLAPWSVEIAGTLLEEVVWRSPERVSATVPMGLAPGRHDVVARSGEFNLRLASGFTVVVPVAPRVDDVEPRRAPSGSEALLRGVGLHLGSVVLVRDEPVATEWLDDRSLRFRIPAGPPGSASVRVETPVGSAWRDDLLQISADG